MAAAKGGGEAETLLLLMTCGFTGAELPAVMEKLKNDSKNVSSHKRRQLFWDAYSKLGTKAAQLEDKAVCLMRYTATPEEVEKGEGTAEVIELTKRQRGLVSGGGVEILAPKFKPPEDPKAKGWLAAWSEEEAQAAYEDLFHAEPCIFISPDGVHVGTRYKRAFCKGLSGPLKARKDLEALVGELAPDKPLKSVSFTGNDPPSVSAYNVFMAGPISKELALPPTVGHCPTTNPPDVYSYFLERRNGHLIAEAEKLITQMKVDVQKGLQPIVAASTKEAAVAYKSSLMKKVYVHESMGKFISRVRADGGVELHVVKGDVEQTEFGKFGKIVFEMYYRVDLATMG